MSFLKREFFFKVNVSLQDDFLLAGREVLASPYPAPTGTLLFGALAINIV